MCRTVLEQQAAFPHPTGHSVRDWRRRSADIGGLQLATKNCGQGKGWMGGHSGQVETEFAELLSDMYTETVNSVNDNSLESLPADLPLSTRSKLIHSLDRWNFEPHLLPDEEVIACTLILFETLFRIEGMQEVIPISMKQISAFIHHLRRIYRYENTYHNFEHALDVLQASQSYLKSAGMVPPPTILLQPKQMWTPKKVFGGGSLISSLGLREIFMLYVAAIGHDVGHPGFSNIFMKNAQTPLSLVFDNTSALEQMHCQLLLRVMRSHGLGVLLDDPNHGHQLKKFLWHSVIATDMSIHEDFMQRFRRLTEGERGSISERQITISQAILKNADISNPSRPFLVSKHWANALIQEWTAQANLEDEFQLPRTAMLLNDPIKEADSQIFFINRFVKPLLQLTVKVIPEMSMYYTHCKSNVSSWTKRKADLLSTSNSRTIQNRTQPPSLSSSSSSLPPPSPALTSTSSTSSWYDTAFPLTLPTYHPRVSSYRPFIPTRCDQESNPDSPSESESLSSSLFSPTSDCSSSNPCPSTSSSAHSPTAILKTSKSQQFLCVPDSHAAIRAAGKLGSLRQKKPANRNSWCAPTNGLTTMFQSAAATPRTIFAQPTNHEPNGVNPVLSGGAAGCASSASLVPDIVHYPPTPLLMTRPMKLQVSP